MTGVSKGRPGSARPSVVLVHGAWHAAWCWQRVVTALAAAGVTAIAVDLPGRGSDHRPLGDLHADAARLTRVLDEVGGQIVLAGHSYGGAVITEAGCHPAVAHLVYVAGLPLDFGETCANAGGAEAAATISHEGRPELGAGFRTAPEGVVTLDPLIARTCLYHDCDADTTAWAVARLGPQLLTGLQQEPRTAAWRARPSTYLVCADDLAVHPDLQRLLARRCTSSAELPTGHTPFLSRPDLVAGVLAGLVAGLHEDHR
jgi:pimeloyl-ACP methyl ester carboxylesterase